ncbi:hypothetical protein SLS62_008847 [Diatrype stigma]|uniref:Small monomeric GTPase n=1 Tax=Diatrype stigma TaxID=117547 RepID=A0AAN9UIS9_9PEZI
MQQSSAPTAGTPPSSNGNPQPPVPISITICGDGGCGKSSITLRLVRSQWTSEYDPTIEDSYSITRRIDGTTYHLSLTDTAGQEEYRGMWASSNLGADAFLMVYDITQHDSLDALQYFNDLIDMEAETRLDNAARARRAGVPHPNPYSSRGGGGAGSGARTIPPVKIVAGNKCDLQESRQVLASQGLDWARKRGCGFMETSARLEVNIEETFALIVRRVAEGRRLAEMGVLDNTEMDRRGVTKPLTPLGGVGGRRKGAAGDGAGDGLEDGSGDMEKRGLGLGLRGPRLGAGQRLGRGRDGFWRNLRCW